MYATATDLVTRFGIEELTQLTNREPYETITPEMLQKGLGGEDLSGYTPEQQTAITAAVGVVTRALDDARAEIDSYLTGRFTLPLASVPRLLSRTAADMARYGLHENQVTETVRQRYKDATSFLKDVAAGRADLGLDQQNQPVASKSRHGAGGSAADRTFSETTLGGFVGL